MKSVTTVADLRTAEALALQPDPTDRDSIARARRRVAEEIRHNRAQLANVANMALRPGELSPNIELGRQILDRLERLVVRVGQLEAMSEAALRAQVDADPEMTGATVQDNGRITVTGRCLRPGCDEPAMLDAPRCPTHEMKEH